MRKLTKKNSLWVRIGLIITVSVAVLTAFAAEPFAPKVDLPKKMDNRGM